MTKNAGHWYGWTWLPPVAAALGLLVLTLIFRWELQGYERSVITWAERDLKVRTELAAATLSESLATSDFRRIHAFGEACEKDGVRLTITSSGGGVTFDSLRQGQVAPRSLSAVGSCGEYVVKLGLPYERVLAPVRRARRGLLMAGCLGGFSVLIVFFFTYRQRMRTLALARLEKFRRDFIADVSHELKTPLTGILGAADLMTDQVADLKRRGQAPPMLERLLEMIRTESVRLDRLARAVLDLARLEQPQIELARETVDLRGVLEESVGACRSAAEKAGSTLRLDVRNDRPVCVSVDPQLIRRAVTNLIQNALRYSGSAEIVVSLVLRASRVEIAVEDHGIGIPPEHRARVFERFHRVDAARSSACGGVGLGLAIVRSIARLHGGDAWLEPVAPSGCRFVIDLPIREKSAVR